MKDRAFNSEHQIWKYAYYSHDGLDHTLDCVLEKVVEWEARNHQLGVPFFTSKYEIRIASFLLYDDLLPDVARKAFSYLMLETVMEAGDKKIKLDNLYVSPPKRGRKATGKVRRRRLETHWLIKEEGYSPPAAYQKVADKHCVSYDAIRRDYERNIKNRAAK